MRPIMEHILKHEKASYLRGHQTNRRKGNLVSRHAEITADRVEEIYQWEFAGEVGDKDDFGTFPDLGRSYGFVFLELPLSEIRHTVNDEPWDRSAKVYYLVQHKAQ